MIDLGLLSLLFNKRQIIGTYPPSHCWYYKLGNPPLDTTEIECATNFSEVRDADNTKDKKSRIKKLTALLKKAETDLLGRCDRYAELTSTSADEYTDYLTDHTDIEYNKMNYYTSLSLVHNHISYYKGMIIECVLALGDEIYKLYPAKV